MWLELALGRGYLPTLGGPGAHEALSSDIGTDVVQTWFIPIICKRRQGAAGTRHSASGDTTPEDEGLSSWPLQHIPRW